jgi:hypothetical protein
MRMSYSLLIFCALLGTSCRRDLSNPEGVRWDEKTSTFSWWGGEVRVPSGFTYQVDAGVDTLVGHFTSPNKDLVIHHDIGGYAGAWANAKDASSFEEWRVEGARVWTARKIRADGNGGSETLVAVTFPDAGCANFFLETSRLEDAKLITYIAQSYRPRSRQNADSKSYCGHV